VGNGEEIRITKDKWIPDAPCHPICPTVDIPDDLKVNYLIDESSRKWNEELVRICFSPADAERILNIALSHNRVLDYVSWPFTKTGTYTVKSAYTMAKSEKVHLEASVRGRGESSDQVGTAKEWKSMWSIKVTPKIKIVLWRLAHNCLPTGQQLRKRNIPAYDLCCHYGRDETTEHAFLTCQYVAESWRELKKRCGLKKLLKPFVSPRQWIFDVLAGCTDREATIFVIFLWHILEARNIVHNG